MPRHAYTKRVVKADAVYDAPEVAKLVNYVMIDGKKAVAQKIVYAVMENLKEGKKNPLEVLRTAINNVAPTVEVKPRRLGGASYLVPIETRETRKIYLSLNWIIDAATARSNKEFKTFADKLTAEIKDAASNVGNAVNKRMQVEKTAESNKVFAHLKW